MRLAKLRIQKYRSIKDTGWFGVEPQKTILVGPNEAGKTAVLRAAEHLEPGPLVKPFDALRDYPRSEYHELQVKKTDPDGVIIAESVYSLEADDQAAVAAIHPAFASCSYWLNVKLSGNRTHGLAGEEPDRATFKTVKDPLRRLAAHADGRVPAAASEAEQPPKPTEQLAPLIGRDGLYITAKQASALDAWLDAVVTLVDEDDEKETGRLAALREVMDVVQARERVLELLGKRSRRLVYFSTYTRVRPLLHLGHLADAIDSGAIDPADPYHFGNYCLLKLLGFSARELSDLGRTTEPPPGDAEAFEAYRAKLDQRDAVLNAASLNLTKMVRQVWQPSGNEALSSDYTIRITADQQYLKVGVEDSLGVFVELDQRSEGFQWLVSFFIVFFAQAADDLKGAILLLDEPGLSLHGLKQREFRITLSRLAEQNQLIFTTHSPFLVGPDELGLVRVVEMVDRESGTKVHTEVVADDPASLLPLQEALGYDLAQSLFAQQRNLILEGLTDYWYLEATADLLRASGEAKLDETIALVPAGGAGKVVYFATILHAHHLKVAALLDSDSAGDQAAAQETLIHTLGNKRILRTKDSYGGSVARPEIEDLLRDTLVGIGKDVLGWDVTTTAAQQPNRPIVEIFNAEISSFSKYKLAKAYVRWTRDNDASGLAEQDRKDFASLIAAVNKATK